MITVKTAQYGAMLAGMPTLSGPVQGLMGGGPRPPVPTAPTPAAAGAIVPNANQPQDNSTRSQLSRVIQQLSVINFSLLGNTDEDKVYAKQVAMNLKLVAAQLEAVVNRKRPAAPAGGSPATNIL